MKKLLPLLLLFIFCAVQAKAQQVAVHGTVNSKFTNETLPGASVMLLRLSDSVRTATITDKDGNFRFDKIAAGQYNLLINYIGFKTLKSTLQVQQRELNLGKLTLEDEATTMKEVEVVGQIPMGEQKGDTTQFNAAAFKVAADASAEDLVTKLPGVVIVDGKIQAQGEEVKQVLVDGKRFFGEDADAALRNLSAEVIENIQIFDKKSDQAEFSGFDDGNRAKTINIVTKPNRRHGKFGKVAAGYGTDERYMAGASVNVFKGDRRFTLTGVTNNINMQYFSAGEAPGGGMRGRRVRRSGGGASGGISTINNISLNYNDEWGEKIETSGTYAFSKNTNTNNSSRYRDYINTSFLNQETYNNSYNTNTNVSHQFSMRLEYKINDNNRLLITPSLSIDNTDAFSRSSGVSLYDTLFAAATEFEEAVYNQTELTRSENANNSENGSYSFNNNINYRHRFTKPGRTISARLNTSYALNDGSIFSLNNVTDVERPDRNKNLDQKILTERTILTWRGVVALAEPVGEQGRLQLEYQVSNRNDDSERLTYDRLLVEQTNVEDEFNPFYSNSSVSDYLTHEARTSYQYNAEKLRMQFETQYQLANLQNERIYPTDYELNTTFHSVLPTAQVEYKFSKTKNLQLDYRTSTDAPSITQLQDVLDNTNPLRFRIGNPNLVQAYQNNMNLRYRSFNTETNRVFSAFITGSLTNNFITNSTSDATPADVPAGVDILRGAQIIKPVNLDGSWNASSFISYGQPIKAIKTNVSLNGGIGYARTPGLINDTLNFSNATNYRLGTSLSSNISENIDFNLSTNSSYNVVTNSIQPERNNNFFNQSTQLRANFTFWKGVVYRTELSHQFNSGLSSGYNNSFILWNMSVSKKLLKKQRGEISLSVNDLLKQNVSIQRSINTNYVEDARSTVLQQFFMMTFSYNIRKFGGANMPGQERGGRRGDRGDFRQEGGSGYDGGRNRE